MTFLTTSVVICPVSSRTTNGRYQSIGISHLNDSIPYSVWENPFNFLFLKVPFETKQMNKHSLQALLKYSDLGHTELVAFGIQL